AQRIAKDACGAERRRAAFDVLQERLADAMALPAVVDRQPEFEGGGGEIEGVARLTDDGLESVDLHSRDHAELIGLADVDEAIKQRRRQLADGAEEAVVAGTRGQAAKIALQDVRSARLDETYGDGVTTARAQHVGMLPE